MVAIFWHTMDAENGIDSAKINKRKFDLFRPVSVRSDGRRIESPNWCVRFQHRGKRTCRTLGTADYRLAAQRAKQLIKKVRQEGWSGAIVLPSSHGSLTIDNFLERYHRHAVSRGLRPRSIKEFKRSLCSIAQAIDARRLADLTPQALQQWVEESDLKPVTLRSVLKNAGSPFSKPSLQGMGMADLKNPFADVVRPKVDREPFNAPSREWITNLMRYGIAGLKDDAQCGFVLALGAGLRWGEIVSLDWQDIQTNGVRVAAEKAKGRRSRIVPISDHVREVLETGRKTGPVLSRSADQVHDEICAWLRKKGVKDRKPIHYLRKCFGSLAVADHGIFIASKLLGHRLSGFSELNQDNFDLIFCCDSQSAASL